MEQEYELTQEERDAHDLRAYRKFQEWDPHIQKFLIDQLNFINEESVRKGRQPRPSRRVINGVDVVLLGTWLVSLGNRINNDPNLKEIVILLADSPLYQRVAKDYLHVLSEASRKQPVGFGMAQYGKFINYNANPDSVIRVAERQAFAIYFNIIVNFENDSYTVLPAPADKPGYMTTTISKYHPTYMATAYDILVAAETAPMSELYRSAKIALYLRMYPDLVDPSINLSLDVKVAVMQGLLTTNPSQQLRVIKDYLQRHNLGLTGWMRLVDFTGIPQQPSAIISALYSFIERQIQPGGKETKEAADEFDRRTGKLSVACDARQYPELEAAALSLLKGASLMSLCQAVTMFQDRLELTGPCSEAEVGDIIDVLTQLIGVLSKRELCALIGIFQ